MSENQTNEPLNTGDTNPASEPAAEPASYTPPATSMKADKPKKKKKKKKSGDKGKAKTVFYSPTGVPQSAPEPSHAEPLRTVNSSPVEAPTEVPQTILTLPVKPDEWFIQPAAYDEDNNLISEETFIFLKDGIEVISMPLSPENFEGLLQLLNERFTTSDSNTEADYFHIRKPLSDSDVSDPVMTLTQRNRILATTSLDQKALKQLIRALQRHVEKPTSVTTWLNRWWHKHKIWRVILIIASLPVVLLFLYTVFWGVTH